MAVSDAVALYILRYFTMYMMCKRLKKNCSVLLVQQLSYLSSCQSLHSTHVYVLWVSCFSTLPVCMYVSSSVVFLTALSHFVRNYLWETTDTYTRICTEVTTSIVQSGSYSPTYSYNFLSTIIRWARQKCNVFCQAFGFITDAVKLP